MSDSQYAVIYDLHSHTTASDGRLTPQELVHRAHEMRVGTLAITDHDSVAAIPAAREEIARAGLPLTLVNGVEISTLWENHEIHIVGLNIDIAYPTMTALLEEQKARRQQRGQMIAERLEKARIPAPGKGRCDWRTVAPSPAAILPVFWLRPAMRKTWRKSSKNTLPAGKPVTCRRSGVQ